jgi:hypothetical protein
VVNVGMAGFFPRAIPKAVVDHKYLQALKSSEAKVKIEKNYGNFTQKANKKNYVHRVRTFF